MVNLSKILTVNTDFVRKRMIDLHMSTYKLATCMGVQPSTVWRMLSGRLKNGITAKTTGKLLNALKLNTDSLKDLFIFD